jgi:hypothetical protein
LTLNLNDYPETVGKSTTKEEDQDLLTQELNANIEDPDARGIESSPAPSSRTSLIDSDTEQSEGSTSSPSSKKREHSQISRGKMQQSKKSKKRGTISSTSLSEEIIYEEENES